MSVGGGTAGPGPVQRRRGAGEGDTGLIKDACGVGFVADLRSRSTRAILDCGLAALRRVAHRGAAPELGAVDGCGVLTAIPWRFLDESFGVPLPSCRTRALGMIFVDRAGRERVAAMVDRELASAGATAVVWRDVPTDAGVVLDRQRASTPRVLQLVAAFDDSVEAADASLYRARLRIEAAARRLGMVLTIVSLSTRTLVHKALVTPDALDRFYPDLADPRFTSPFVVFHQRFSTNTSADWALAQPFRTLAHNGEINTIAGNRLWMRARLADPTSLSAFAAGCVQGAGAPGVGNQQQGAATGEPISTDGSDSRTIDDAVELMRHNGYSIAHALARLVPPAWERHENLAPDVRAFYEFQSLVSEPWDGPSALVFADGRCVGAALDRNGFRPARIVTTADGVIAVASEVGVLPADEHEIVDRDRLGPGDIIVVDLERGAVMRTNEIRRRLASRHPYRSLVASAVRELETCGREHVSGVRLSPSREASADRRSLREGRQADPGPAEAERHNGSESERRTLTQRQAAFGCSREEIELLLKPMVSDAHEAVGSMGDDAPPAVLSSRPRLFTDFFRQRFAQVTNPPVDPYRESSVMSLTTVLGAHGSFVDELAPRPLRVVLRSPVLTPEQFDRLRAAADLKPTVIETLSAVATPAPCGNGDAAPGAVSRTRDIESFAERLDEIADAACEAVASGSALVLLTDRGATATRAPLPAVLATAAVHHALIRRGLRMRCSVVVDSGHARDAHQVAALCAFGASAVCPWLGYDTIATFDVPDDTGCELARARYRLALERGLMTVMSKMGVCTFAGYSGAQLFEILGLDASVVHRFFPGTPSPVGGFTLQDIASTAIERHRRAFALTSPPLEYPGLHTFRRDGEYHGNNPVVIRGLQRARDEGPSAYATFASHVYKRPPAAIRDLVEFAPLEAVALDEVEPADAICRRFFASAMSVGALSPEAHRVIARAMNRLGARSNSGEGGEEPDRFARSTSAAPSGELEWDGSRTKQVASARFGVTPAYLRSADELQIKIAQGSKPGEGGQLPAIKVVPHIARLRHAQPGTPLISPPVHHDIYSIEDLAQLIYDLRAFHPSARINVKLVASTGVGIIAAGVAKAGADAIQISGHDGGTGASPRGSIKHAGMPWEIGLAEAHRALAASALRGRVVLQTDGGLKTGRDIAIAAALGADEYGFGTAALVAIGCVMARQCHANTCPVGIATQREDLRAGFTGTADMLVGYLRLVAEEVRQILASLGLRRLEDLVGRSDLLRRRAGVAPSVSVDWILDGDVVRAFQASRYRSADTGDRSAERRGRSAERLPPPLADGTSELRRGSPERRWREGGALRETFDRPLVISGRISNTDRAFGAAIAGEIAARYGDAGLPDGSVQFSMTGSAGQSFGAFSLPGMRLVLVGDANDGVGKGMHGGEIVVCPPARERGRARQVLVGNSALYGATGGRVFIAGAAGERFAVRNSGASAVVEGVGNHGCEYMTGGTVVILGPCGSNFAAGMTGGVAYVLDRHQRLARRVNPDLIAVGALSQGERKLLEELLVAHERATGSRVARAILRKDPAFSSFVAVRSAAARPADGIPSSDDGVARQEEGVVGEFQPTEVAEERAVNV
jgi:glutamate synthase domain-containing protein 2/glutamate synthase domain-containing protein 1/glutamate synthase domain-containing protein 3